MHLQPLSAVDTLVPGQPVTGGPGSKMFRYSGPTGTLQVTDDADPVTEIFDVHLYGPDTAYLGNPRSNADGNASGSMPITNGQYLEIYSDNTWSIAAE